MGVEPSGHINSAECIRCGDCVRACPTGAIALGLNVHRESDALKQNGH